MSGCNDKQRTHSTIYIDQKSYSVDVRRNLLEACLSLGINLPYFCWHPALGSIGACRQCAVKEFKDENDTKGRIVMACMTAAKDGMRISVEDDEAQMFRAGVIEWLMESHPHDCPVCDEGGECHLQDMTVMTGHTYRRFRFKKRTFPNQNLGPFITHEMNRCITCYRCVRFYHDYAGGHDLRAFASRNHVYFGRHADGPLESEFSGNIIEVCPTGVFNDKIFTRHYTRKWDLQTAPSICTLCSLGCNTLPGERSGSLRRVVNRYHSQVNGYFLCDRGRFGNGFVNSERRLRHCLLRNQPTRLAQSVSSTQALHAVAQSFHSQSNTVIGIGSPRASLEANFALRTLVGADNFYPGMSDNDNRLLAIIAGILQAGAIRTPSLHDVEQSDAIFILGEDLTNTAPRLALALRQSVRQAALAHARELGIPDWQDSGVRNAAQELKSPLFIASCDATRLDEVATQTWRGAPDDIARLGFAVAHELNAAAPEPAQLTDEMQDFAKTIAAELQTAQRPLIVSGTGCGSEAVIQAAANIALALKSDCPLVELSLAVPECNSLGVALLGGGTLADAFAKIRDGAADSVILLENDLYRRASRSTVDAFFSRTKQLVALDFVSNHSTGKADVVLPAASFAETDGTLISNEGRAQRYFQVIASQDEIQASWRRLRDIARQAGKNAPGNAVMADWRSFDDVTQACAAAVPALQGITAAAPSARFRIAGQKIPRQHPRHSGRTALHTHISMHEAPPPNDSDSALNFSMEGYPGQPPAALVTEIMAPGWSSVESLHKFQDEVGGELRGGDAGVRLFEPRSEADGKSGSPPTAPEPAFFQTVPIAYQARNGEMLIVPLHHIFGSEPLSLLTPGVAERSPAPYLALHPDAAAELRLNPGDLAELTLAGVNYRLPVTLKPDLPPGLAGLPAGLPDLAGIPLPARGALSRLQA